MRAISGLTLLSVVFLAIPAGHAVEIRGQYLESRTCDVYTGPCFANGEMGLGGKEAVMAWKVDEGGWNGTSLEGLSVALIVKAQKTLGNDGIFPMQAGRIDSVILVDEAASDLQQQALIDFVKQTASVYTQHVNHVERVPLTLENDHHNMEGVFKAGDLAQIQTRKLGEHDCICTNEMVYYKPLTDVHYAAPAYSVKQSYTGDGLNCRWSSEGSRSAFLAIFRK
ncbi:MAG: DUF1326 domain-containing protein [Planctomycetaceae bacterium]|nr:DUF1326 domain-containing protein [Planctomycetaceae bacterium]